MERMFQKEVLLSHLTADLPEREIVPSRA